LQPYTSLVTLANSPRDHLAKTVLATHDRRAAANAAGGSNVAIAPDDDTILAITVPSALAALNAPIGTVHVHADAARTDFNALR
jgi:hypothetical protein